MKRRWGLVIGGFLIAQVVLHGVWNTLGIGGDWATMVFGDVLLTIVPAAAGAACIVAATRSRLRERRAWWLLGAGCLAWAAGDAIWTYYEVFAQREVPFPSTADLGFLALIPLAGAAVATFPAAPMANRSRARTFADGLILAASLLFVSWTAVLGPTVRAGADNTLAAVVGIAYPAGDVVLMTAVLFIISRAPRGSRTPFAFIGSGLLALAVADTGFLYETLRGVYSTGSLVDVGWNAGFTLIAFGAIRATGEVTRASESVTRRTTVLRLLLPYAGVAVTMLIACGQWIRRGHLESFLFWDTMVIVALVVARQLLGLLEIMSMSRGLEATVDARTAQLQASERRFRSLVQHSSDVVTIIDERGGIAYQSDSVHRIFGHASRDLVGIRLSDAVHPRDRERVETLLGDLIRRDHATAQIEFRMRHRNGTWREVDATITNLLADVSVNGLVLNIRDITERKILESQLAHQAFHDSLTDLPNRALFMDRVQGALDRAARRGTVVAMLYLDLDGFKGVNDTHGHHSGDELLIAVAARLREAARGADTVARFGGDEFAILIEDVDDASHAAAFARRVLDSFDPAFRIGDRDLYAHASIGISMSSADSIDPGELVRNADVAMYMAKGRGKRRFEVFDPVMHALVVERVELEADLRQAIERDELAVHYQPIVETATGRIVGVEALLRWNHPERGPVSPADFIPVAEDSGLIVEIGAWVLEQSCRQVAGWQRAHPWFAGLTVSVNVSVRQLHEPGFVAEAVDVLARTGLDPACLVFEITESVLLDDGFDAVAVVHSLKELGVQLAIDDFGTGYSSLGYLRDLPIDTLKVDRSFVQLLGGGPEDSALTRAIVKLSHTLHLRTVAEGVECPNQVEELVAMGCEFAQGFHFARPADSGTIEALLRAGRPLPDVAPPLAAANASAYTEALNELATT